MIRSDGRAHHADVQLDAIVQATLGDHAESLTTCLSEAAHAITYTPPTGGVVRVEYPLRFVAQPQPATPGPLAYRSSTR